MSWVIRNGFWVFGKWTPSICTFLNAVIHEHLSKNTALVSHSVCFPLYTLRLCPPTQKLPAFTTSQVTALSGFRLTPALPKCIQVRNQIPNNGMVLRSSAAAKDNETLPFKIWRTQHPCFWLCKCLCNIHTLVSLVNRVRSCNTLTLKLRVLL